MKLGMKTIQELKNKKISIEDSNNKYFYTKKDGINIDTISKLLNENICSFQEIVEKFKSIKNKDFDPCLYYLLYNKEFFKELIDNNVLIQEDLSYLLNKIDEWYELRELCFNTPLIKKILNEFVLNKELVDKFNRLLEEDEWREAKNVHTIFDLIKSYNSTNKEILRLNELNRKVYLLNSFDLNEDQQLELAELLKDNKIARNRLIQIIDNNLEDQYDFESLKNLLTKDNEKKKIKMNF